MKKRKTKMLRHEWHEHHFTLKGTRLAMHKDARALETLEYIDIDDYAIACSSLASGSKLNAAFKAMNISRDKKKDEAAFAFQLIPASMDKTVRLRKRESAMASNGPSEGKDAGAKSKTHYFAVKSRDERIDWMRELMLAKALKQKSEGFQVNVNGNMI
jgi:PH domain